MDGNQTHKLDILLAEDNAGDVCLLREALKEAGLPYVLHVVNNGTDAIDYLHRLSTDSVQWPDLVILDINMPGKTGRQIMAHMQTMPALRSLPVAVLTTSGGECGICDDFPRLRSIFAAKTPDFEQLVEIVRKFEEFAMQAA